MSRSATAASISPCEQDREQSVGPFSGKKDVAIQTVAITGGKGGIGKSNIAVNLAAAMGSATRNILLLDADLQLGNIDRLLNLQPRYNLSHVVSGERRLSEVVIQGPTGVKVIPGASGVIEMARLSQIEHANLIYQFSELHTDADTLIIDIATGLSDSVLNFSRAAREVVVVVCDEPTAIQDAFTTMRALHENCQVRRFRIVANKTESSRHGLDLYAKLLRHTDRHLDVLLDFCGSIPFDPQVKLAVCQQRSVVEAYPRSPAALAFRKLAARLDRWPKPTEPGGHIEFFVERLIQTAGGTR
ncbi:MAG: P-loop NTPase [Granulosicoccus sp.]